VNRLPEIEPFRIGAAEVRPGTREVLGPGGREVIEPKVMQVLLMLAAAKGEVVTRDALVSECWDGRAVSEDAISRVVQRLRRLSEGPAAGAFQIKTVHKVGYRLLEADSAARDGRDPVSETPPAEAAGIDRRAVLGLAALLAAGAGGAWIFGRGPGRGRVSALIAQSEQAMGAGLPDAEAQGTGFLEQAVRLEPDNALAWGRLALARTYVAEYAPPDRTAAAVSGVQDAARRALAIDGKQIDALSALAILPPYYGDWLAAEKRMKAVLAVDPGHLPTRDSYAFMLTAVGRAREGGTARIAIAAEAPLHATYQFRLIYAHWMLGQLDEADRAADRAIQLWPKYPAAWFARYYTYALTGRPNRALAHVNDAAGRPELPAWLIESLSAASTALASRRPADVEGVANRLIREVSLSPAQSVNAIMLLCGLGEIDRAFQVADAYLLEQGPLVASLRWRTGQVSLNDVRRRLTNMLFLPCSAPMRADPRFAVLMKRTGLHDYWIRAGVRPDHLL
jgi:DNA-binding winged helix-turn-helix (wHTH) protein